MASGEAVAATVTEVIRTRMPLAAFGAVFAALALRHPVRTWRESRQRARQA